MIEKESQELSTAVKIQHQNFGTILTQNSLKIQAKTYKGKVLARN